MHLREPLRDIVVEPEKRDVNHHEAGVDVAAAIAHVTTAGNGDSFEIGHVARQGREHPVPSVEKGAQSAALECAHHVGLMLARAVEKGGVEECRVLVLHVRPRSAIDPLDAEGPQKFYASGAALLPVVVVGGGRDDGTAGGGHPVGGLLVKLKSIGNRAYRVMFWQT